MPLPTNTPPVRLLHNRQPVRNYSDAAVLPNALTQTQ